MPGEIFYWVLNISILGSGAGLIVLLLRRIRVLPRFGVYLLWALPLIRLWMPAGIASRYSLLSFISRYMTKTIVVREAMSFSPELSMTNIIQAAQEYFPVVYRTDLLRDIFSTAGIIWLTGASAALLCSAALYIFTKSVLKDAEHIKDNIYISEKVISPAVYGILRPRIILPAGISDADLEYILRHERIHIRRKDNFWRAAAAATACIHWFNPLVWFYLRCFFADMELACDAGVLKELDDNERKEYASALLSCSAQKTCYASAFGGVKTRMRIESILSYQKLTLFSGICFAVLFIVIAAAVITNATGG